jgi:hypothetical protein
MFEIEGLRVALPLFRVSQHRVVKEESSSCQKKIGLNFQIAGTKGTYVLEALSKVHGQLQTAYKDHVQTAH